MNPNNGSVPPLPPRRTISMGTSDAHLLQSVPPPPQQQQQLQQQQQQQQTTNLINLNNKASQRPHNLTNNSFSNFLTNPTTLSQPYIQWNTQCIPTTPSYWPNNSFTNYTYSASMSATVSPMMTTPLAITAMPHSMSAPNFSNPTYTYSLEEIQRLYGKSNNKHELLVNNKSNNNDLIDLDEGEDKSGKNVLQLFDPLLEEKEDNKELLNFSNNFEVEETVEEKNEKTDEVDRRVIQTEETVILRKKDEPIVSEKVVNTFNEPFRVLTKKYRANEELQHFCTQLTQLRRQYPYNDFNTNIGLVISPTLDSQQDKSLSVKLVIETQISPQTISFTCNVDTSVEHIISHVICTLVEDASQVKMDDYMLKVYGLSEYFAADSVLANYLYVHQCHKFDKDVHLSLVHIKDLNRCFARLQEDEDLDFTCDELIPKSIVCKFGELSTETINILLENFDREIGKLRTEARISSGGQLQSQSIIQTVKAICTHLSSLETIPLTESYTNFSQLCNAFGVYKRENSNNSNNDDSSGSTVNDLDSKLWEVLDHALVKLRQSLTELIDLYSKTFPVEFYIKNNETNKTKIKEISSSMDTLLCYTGVLCQLQPEWLTLYKEFKIILKLLHGDRQLSTCSTKTLFPTKAFFHRLSIDEWLQFDYPIYNLPREVRLEITLIGIKSESEMQSSSPTTSSVNNNQETNNANELAIGFIYLFDFKQHLRQGQYLIPLWMNSPEFSIENDKQLINSNCLEKNNPIVHLIFPENDFEIKFPEVLWDENNSTTRKRMNSLDSATQTELFQILSRNPLEPMSCGDREQLWDRRYYLYDCSEALPKVLLASHSWEWSSLSDIYSMVDQWSPLTPVESMQLLLPSFPDYYIRKMTIKWLKKLSTDELCDFLPQLVQALRFDAHLDSPLIWFLFDNCLSSVRFSHHFYWILKCNLNDQQFTYRTRIYLNSLLAICGRLTSQMIDREENICQKISIICDHVKSSKESHRLQTLLLELETVNDYLVENPTVLPLSPSMRVCGLDVKICSYFPSNSLPLKLVFKNDSQKHSTIEAIFKVGDDLRQDMLSMQMILIMDKIWLKSGLDLRMITFSCIATNYKKGMVEMVANSETLRKIQLEHGLTGSFKDRPIAEWLQKHNTSELEYHSAVDNFTYSCAGYSVATYILGICDRHNDNIMLTTSGHLFHIDFGKFLGDSQMMAGIKRDRVAFVLTQDMAYVINGGDRPSKQFQFFIDLCCQAFNLLRKNTHFLLSLFSLMISSQICGLTKQTVKYIHKALMPGLSESEAMSQFTRMIEESLRSRFTQFNFFIHNLAQLRFTGDHNDSQLLSFIPKKFSRQSDGQIINLDIKDCYKKYEPEKVYYYVIRVERQYQPDPSYIHRTYREFLEFNDKISSLYPLAKFHCLPRNTSTLMRSNTRDSALQRMNEINLFLKGLMLLAEEISHGDIVYTFFHPLLRDQEGATHHTLTIASPPGNNNNTINNNKIVRRESLYGPTISGQIKLSIIYKNMSLIIMIMHAKNVQSLRSANTPPDCYVKTYLIPDPQKLSKRKTKVITKSSHPTFMEMIIYRGLSLDKIQQKTLQVSVWDYDRVTENVFLGATYVHLKELQLTNETCDWFPLQANH